MKQLFLNLFSIFKKRHTVFILIILLLTIGIIGVGIKIINIEKKSSNQSDIGKVKAEQHEMNQDLKFLPTLKDITLPPQKKEKVKDPNVYLNSGILLDTNTFYPLWEKNVNDRVPIASTTKIMSAIVVLENYNLNDTVTFSTKAAQQIGSDAKIKAGEILSVESLLKASLIVSANDAIYALAEKVGVENFVSKMNEKAKWLNLQNTHFNDPAGLDDNGYSSAYDLAVITSYALKNKKFAEIVKIPETKIYSADNKYVHELESSNRLLKSDNQFYLPGTLGIKTGFTPTAGHCLVSAINIKNSTLVSVVLNTSEYTNEASAKETKKLLEWGINSFYW
ncbi:MAG: serine hydrolase [Patescibacteria group bacterium]|nr:serine hydrolase [Patescibacteria group bacterium]